MKTLLLLRHAKSSRKDSTWEDHERPLNKRGHRDAPRMGELLKAEGLTPDLIVSSTARRTRETVDDVVTAMAYDGPLTFRDELYLATSGELLAEIQLLPEDAASVLLVGHNPGFEELLAELTGKEKELPTAALAQLELNVDHWSDAATNSARLVNLWRPRELE